MNKVEIPPREDVVGLGSTNFQLRRGQPKAVQVLLPVWGYEYIRQFMEFGLPTLLAPGNVPALAAALPTVFVILASVDDEETIRESANFRRLAAVCKTEIRPIDHLITDGNYSTTITLAYAEAVRATGEAMVDTCFFFLVSDYIMADGSLGNALKRMQGGASAVTVGNFQITREDALPWLKSKIAGGKDVLALPPRDLMQWALSNLHPSTIANTVNIPFNHNTHTNRLFWRVDGNTLLGRFYLMHMLCVRPEITDFVIGSSCDYSFVPEMCPSGNVEAITDSDEYLVIEMQPRNHETGFLRPGPLKTRRLAKSLNEWTTSIHRDNAKHTLIFHADQVPAETTRNIEMAQSFIDDVDRHLQRMPKPYRGHPYWRGAMAAFFDATGRKLDDAEWRYALGLPATGNWISDWLLYRAKYTLMGQPPHVLPWHPAWPDYRAVLGQLRSFFTNPDERLLMLSNEPTAFTLALADGGERVYRFRCNPFLKMVRERLAPLHGKFDLCLLEVSETDMMHGDKLVDRIVPLMKNGGRIIVFVQNRRISDSKLFTASVMWQSTRFIRSGALPTEVQFIPANWMRWSARRNMYDLRMLMNKVGWLSAPTAVLGGGLLLLLTFIGNLDISRRTRRVAPKGHTSSFVMQLNVDSPKVVSPPRSVTKSKAHSKSGALKADLLRPDGAGAAAQSIYQRCVALKSTIGLSSLGLLTNQLWYNDPRSFAVLVSRYRFVARLLADYPDVAEVGTVDAFGARLVAQQVPDVTIYGPDPDFIEDIRARQEERWPLRSEFHDITEGPLPRLHSAIFSLDFFEQVDAENEQLCLGNLCKSLIEKGVLVIGAAVPELQSDGPPPTAGELKRKSKSGRALKALLEMYFGHVSMFSVIDDVVQPELSPKAEYLFAVCTTPHVEAGIDRNEILTEFGQRKQRNDVPPLFEIGESKLRDGYFVNVTRPDSETQRIEGFKTVADASRWIANEALEWIYPGLRSKD